MKIIPTLMFTEEAIDYTLDKVQYDVWFLVSADLKNDGSVRDIREILKDGIRHSQLEV